MPDMLSNRRAVQVNPVLALFTLLMNIDIPGLLVLIAIFSVPVFFFVRRVYRRKFEDDEGKVIAWSIVTSILFSTLLVLALVAGLVFWLITTERMQ